MKSEKDQGKREPQCPCGKWPAYEGAYDQDGGKLRCRGCMRLTTQCMCR